MDRMYSFFKWFRRKWAGFPLLGYLAYCTCKNHYDSLKELSQTLVFSLATFWFTAALLMAYKSNVTHTYFELLEKTANAGQLFIFTVSFLGPVFLIAGEDPKDAKVFPGRTTHLIVLFLVAALSAGFYAIQLGARENPGSIEIDPTFLLRASIVAAVIAVILRYLAVVYRKSTLNFDPEEQLRAPAKDFAAEFANRSHG
jgi:hypothetical protein